FFQAEDGIRDLIVTGVQTCALPIYKCWTVAPHGRSVVAVDPRTGAVRRWKVGEEPFDVAVGEGAAWIPDHDGARLWRLDLATGRSEERRVGKECRSRVAEER